jgi:peroxiredoxin
MTRSSRQEQKASRRPGVPGLWLAFACSALLALQPGQAHAGKLKAGDPLPQFSAADLEENVFDTKETAGKVLLLDFWSIGCSSCLEEMPHLVDLYNKYHEQGLVALGINTDRKEKRVRSFVNGSLPYEMTYRNVVDKRMQIMRLLSVAMLPTTILVDTSGVVRMFHVGYKPGFEKDLEEEIHKLLPKEQGQ